MAATQNRVRAGIPTGGQFAAHTRGESVITLAAPTAPSTIAEQEAADLFRFDNPDATVEDFDAALFDTWASGDDFDTYTADPDSDLLRLGPDAVSIWDLPSGGVVAFWK